MKFSREELKELYRAVKILESGEVLLGVDIDKKTVKSLIDKISKNIDSQSKIRIAQEVKELVKEAKEFDETDREGERLDFDREFGPNYPYSETLKLLNKAIEQGNPVMMEYYSASGGEFTQRKVMPESIERGSGTPYLNAFCYLRGAERVFKLGRIKTIKMVEK